MASLAKTAVFEASLGTIKSIQLSKQGPSTPVLVLLRKNFEPCLPTLIFNFRNQNLCDLEWDICEVLV